MLETSDQTVDREVIQPGRDHLSEGWRLSDALRAAHAEHRQGQGAALALVAEPRQLGLARHANGQRDIAAFIA